MADIVKMMEQIERRQKFMLKVKRVMMYLTPFIVLPYFLWLTYVLLKTLVPYLISFL